MRRGKKPEGRRKTKKDRGGKKGWPEKILRSPGHLTTTGIVLKERVRRLLSSSSLKPESQRWRVE